MANVNGRIPELDGLRGVAVLIIIVWHYIDNKLIRNDSLIVNFVLSVTSNFWNGVDLFFILSGFLIGGILLKNKGSKNYFKTFYLRRIFRIFPLYYFILGVYVVSILAFPILIKFDFLFNDSIPIWSYALFCQNYLMIIKQTYGAGWLAVTWSLAIEEQFYLLLPALVFSLNRKILTIVIISLIILAAVFRIYSYPERYLTYLSFQCRMDELFTGVLISVLFEKAKIVNFLKSRRTSIFIIFFILSGLMLFISFYDLDILTNFLSLIYYPSILFFSTLIIIALLFKDSLIAKILRIKLLRQVGNVSYGIYLIHPIVIGIIYKVLEKIEVDMFSNFRIILVALGAFIITFALSLISYHFFESKLIKFSHRYTY